jgi:putative Ca2+/H+ antiporter (TMEM165/GDT1 family)
MGARSVWGKRCSLLCCDPRYQRTPAWKLFISTGVVAFAEIGDKTQLLAFLLAATPSGAHRAGASWWLRLPITLVAVGVRSPAPWDRNHALDPACLVAAARDAGTDKFHEEGRRCEVFIATVAFFIAEMGDKTQIATVALAARFESVLAVVTGTTLAA